MKKQIILLLFFYSLFYLFAQENLKVSYSDFITKLNMLEQEGRYSEAKEIILSSFGDYVDKKFELIKELEYVNDKLENYVDNIELWKFGHNQGFFFLLNKSLPKYKPYLQFPKFDSLAASDAKLREEALSKSSTLYEIVKPDNYDTNHSYPLIIIFHGGGRNLEKAKQSWKLSDEIFSKYTVVYLQSYLHYDSETFGWRSSDIRTHEEVKNIYQEIINDNSIDTSRIFLFGISAGGTMALDIAFLKTIPVSGVLGICSGKPRDLNQSSIANSKLKIFMLGGENDFYLNKQNEMAQMFEEADLIYKQIVIPGMGHDFPEDLETKIKEGINFIDR